MFPATCFIWRNGSNAMALERNRKSEISWNLPPPVTSSNRDTWYQVLTSDDVDRHVGGLPDRGVAGVLAGVGGEGLTDQQRGLGDGALLRDLADPAPAGVVRDGLKYFHCSDKFVYLLF